MVTKIGDVISIVGLMVTFVAYLVEHRGRSLGQLEPGVAGVWSRTRSWVARLTGRHREVRVTVGATLPGLTFNGSAVVMAWSPINPEDELSVRVDKVARNLDALRSSAEALRAMDQKRVEDIGNRLSERLGTVEGDIASQRQRDWDVTTKAMRWQVRGLGIAVLGSLVSLFG